MIDHMETELSVAATLLLHALNNLPQSAVLAHFFGSGFVDESQCGGVLHVTVPGAPDEPAATPHLVAHPVGLPFNQVPGNTKVQCVQVTIKKSG